MSSEQIIDEFPVDIFPGWIQNYINEHHDKSGWSKDVTAIGVLAALSAAAGSNKVFDWQFNQPTPAILWLCVVGSPGSNKTHPVEAALEPINEKDVELHQECMNALNAYNKHKNDKSEGNKERIPKPALSQILIRDTTSEALVKALQKNPSGILIWRDELAGWFNDMNRYSNGGDEQFYLQLFNGNTITVNRKGEDIPTRVDKPVASLIGTIQPGVLKQLTKYKNLIDSGTLDRFLFAFSDTKMQSFTMEVMKEDTVLEYKHNIKRILAVRSKPITYILTRDAKTELINFSEYLMRRYELTVMDYEKAIYAKLMTYTHRIPQLLQLAHDFGQTENNTVEINKSIIEKMCRLLRFFEYNAFRARRLIFSEGKLGQLDRRQEKFYKALPSDSFKFSEAMSIAS
ncbi:MAG: DUF3987 domain-containing protein [Balneolaceae bacterium]|nr:DUF3987 domain-containing protein [Balneolaceae bacterium]